MFIISKTSARESTSENLEETVLNLLFLSKFQSYKSFSWNTIRLEATLAFWMVVLNSSPNILSLSEFSSSWQFLTMFCRGTPIFACRV